MRINPIIWTIQLEWIKNHTDPGKKNAATEDTQRKTSFLYNVCCQNWHEHQINVLILRAFLFSNLSGSPKGWDPGLLAEVPTVEEAEAQSSTILELREFKRINTYPGRNRNRQNNTEADTYLWPSSWAMVKAKLRPLSSASTHFLLALHTPPK